MPTATARRSRRRRDDPSGALRPAEGPQVPRPSARPTAAPSYDSRGEAEYARRLDLLKAAGAIHDWRRGGEWVLLDAPPAGSRRDRITCARTSRCGTRRPGAASGCVDFKGVVTAVFRLKAKLWKARYPDVPLLVARADGTETRL